MPIRVCTLGTADGDQILGGGAGQYEVEVRDDRGQAARGSRPVSRRRHMLQPMYVLQHTRNMLQPSINVLQRTQGQAARNSRLVSRQRAQQVATRCTHTLQYNILQLTKTGSTGEPTSLGRAGCHAAWDIMLVRIM